MTDRLIPFRRADGHAGVPDEALVSACGRGDTAALEELFQRHGDRIHRIVARLGGVDRRDLDDIVQATFIAVLGAARRFDRRSTVGTWIVGIALHVAQRHVRGEARRRLAMLAAADVQANAHGGPSFGPAPDEEVANRQAMARLVSGFEALPLELRTVFTLCDLEGMRGVDAARALGVPEGTVWRRLHDARLRLRAAMQMEPRT